MRYTPLTHLVKPLELGNKRGTCIFCGVDTEHGFSVDEVPETFVDWDKAVQGEEAVICEHCHRFLKDPNIRRKPWVIANSELRLLNSKKDALAYIKQPPEPPYAIYIPIQGKKHGWINMMTKGVNWSKNIVSIGLEDTVITIDREKFLEDLETLQTIMHQHKLKKTELETPGPKLATKIGTEKYRKVEEIRSRVWWPLIIVLI